MYLSNGLRVVSVDLPVFTEEMRRELTLCANNKPETLAKGIEQATNVKYNSNLLKDLNKDFTESIDTLILNLDK